MGTYAYTLRKRTRRIRTTDRTVDCNLYKFSYKERWEDTRDRDRAGRTAERAWTETDHTLVAVGDNFEDGDAVYADCTQSIWYDTVAFPGRQVGWLRTVANRLYLVDRSPWEAYYRGDLKIWRREGIANGVTFEETCPREPGEGKETRWHLEGNRPARQTSFAQPEPVPVY